MATKKRSTSKSHKFREEVVNVLLATALSKGGLAADPETIQGPARPDVLIDLEGMRFVIEGREVKKRESLIKSARQRLLDGIADLSAAVFYPKGLLAAPSLDVLSRNVAGARYSGVLFHFSGGDPKETPFDNYAVADLVDLTRHAFQLIVEDDVVTKTVGSVEGTIETCAKEASESNLFFASEALEKRLRAALGLD